MKSFEIDLGAQIRAYRKKKKLSLIALSRLTGIAASNLSSIELNKSSPTLITLVKISRAFDMKVGAFLDDVLYSKAIFCCGSKAGVEKTSSRGVSISLLTAGMFPGRLHARVLSLETDSQSFAVDGQGTDRFVYCLKGSVAALVDDEKYVLMPNDGIYLRPDAVAICEIQGAQKASILVVNSSGMNKPSY